ncbi:MAG TPA: hypothetical protein VGM42_14720 [Rhodopila sp.]|jgi:hypothetical protein
MADDDEHDITVTSGWGNVLADFDAAEPEVELEKRNLPPTFGRRSGGGS